MVELPDQYTEALGSIPSMVNGGRQGEREGKRERKIEKQTSCYVAKLFPIAWC